MTDTAALPTIIAETAQYFVINKPPLLHSVRNPNSSTASLVDWLVKELPNQTMVSEDAGLITRLDYETSGLLIAAKNKESLEQLFALGKQDRIKKTYLAVVEGILKTKITVSTLIGSRSRSAKKVHVLTAPRPRFRLQEATTLLSPYQLNEAQENSIIRAEIFQGRRHQIRAHSAHVGFPLLGDKLYGAKKDAPKNAPPFLLHAWRVSVSSLTEPNVFDKFEAEPPPFYNY